MSKGKLTRQELGWLLTQEAQGAAERLRVGVQVLKTHAPPPAMAPVSIEEAPPSSAPGGVDASLNALDDVMRMLSSLHTSPASQPRGRRGRIDLAALMWEVAPDARVSIEPGSGTEIYGDEGEIRRMLHVLLGHGSGGVSQAGAATTGTAVTIKREGDDVLVAVVLGPDSTATMETERAWLSRMAIRFGGRHSIDGNTESLWLPAEDAAARDERYALRKELDEARKQGEAYARELAAVFAQGEEAAAATSSSFPPGNMEPSIERLAVLSRFAAGIAAELKTMLSPIGRELHSLRAPSFPPGSGSRPPPPMSGGGQSGSVEPSEGDARVEGIRKRLLSVQDFIAALASIGELDPAEPSIETDVAELTRTAARAVASRIQRQEVEVVIEADQTASARIGPKAVAVMIRELIGQAIGATPRGGRVKIVVTPKTKDLGTRLTIDDEGPTLPGAARRPMIALELDPGTYGRPTAVPLYVAAEIAAWQRALLELGEAPVAEQRALPASGGLRITVTFPR